MRDINIDIMLEHYLLAALWADAPEGTSPRITEQAKNKAREVCEKFASLIRQELWGRVLQCPDYWSHPDCNGHPEAALGHDLWLTSRGHGAGFWDRDALPKQLRDFLSDLCGWGNAIGEPAPLFYRGWFYL